MRSGKRAKRAKKSAAIGIWSRREPVEVFQARESVSKRTTVENDWRKCVQNSANDGNCERTCGKTLNKATTGKNIFLERLYPLIHREDSRTQQQQQRALNK